MRVAVLAHGLRAGGGRVVGTNILDNLVKNIGSHEFFFTVPDLSEYRRLELEESGNKAIYYRRRYGHLGRWFFDRFILPFQVRKFRPDVVLGLGNLGVRGVDVPQAFLVHYPYLFYGNRNYGKVSLFRKVFHLYFKLEFQRHLSLADLVFCQTKTIENRLRTIWDYQGKTVITPNVVSNFLDVNREEPVLPAPLEEFADHFKVFYLTRYYPHKGLETLVEVFDHFSEELTDIVAVITIAPEQHRNADRLLNSIRYKGLEDRIINVGPLHQDQLSAYYLSCDCLVMPTRMESFSGTYLEAMHFGLPILTSDLDFAHEVCGDAALFFDPWDLSSIRDAILRMKNDPGLQRDLVEVGKKQLAEYHGMTWEDITGTIIDELSLLSSR
jgi:glycosyltransferase involved in cell wall biosynthesis